MKLNIDIFIQEELKKLTNKNFTKKYISQYIIPIINNLYHSKNNKFILSGSQGSGKSTLGKLLKLAIEKFYKKKVMLLSIDDYYLSKNQRLKLSKKIHPLLLTRGVPGTHDIKALKYHINQFQNQNFPISTPIFNKLKDDISKKRKVIKNAQILLLDLDALFFSCAYLHSSTYLKEGDLIYIFLSNKEKTLLYSFLKREL